MKLDKSKLDIIEKEIRECGRWAVEKQSSLHVERKDDLSPVTEVDTGISDRLLSLLSSLFPEAGIISEEAEDGIRYNAPYSFVLDPIDGTDVFSQGFPSFCIALGILDGMNEPVGAMIYAPRFGRATPDGLFVRLDPEGEVVMNGKPFSLTGNKLEVRQVVASSSSVWRFDFSRYRGKTRILGSTVLHILSPVLFPGIEASVNEPCYLWDMCSAHAVIRKLGMDLWNTDGTLFTYDEEFLSRKRGTKCTYGAMKDALPFLMDNIPQRKF